MNKNLQKRGLKFINEDKEIRGIKKRSNSNEEIKLISENQTLFIKKSWQNINRGLRSIEKQINFDEISISNLIIRSPKVLKTEIFENIRFEATMQYIEGYSGSDISLIGTREVSMNLKEALSMLINNNFEKSKLERIHNSLFVKKIDEIINASKNDNQLQIKLKILKKEFLKEEFLEIPCGKCHGDLTLSNIIISRSGSLNFIDFLPTFVESPLWDIVKIYQDLKYGWSYRDLKGPEKANAKIFFLNCLPSQIYIYEKVFKKEILMFDALNLARLAPYIKDKNTRTWIINSLDNSLSKFNNL